MASPSTTFNGQISDVNRQLAEKIVADRAASDNKYVRQICLSDDFYKDPTAHLINEMIERGVGMCRMDDGARSLVIGKIPGFIEKVKSPDYLRSFALEYFKNNPGLDKIMDVFDKSIKGSVFKNQLNRAVSHFERNRILLC